MKMVLGFSFLNAHMANESSMVSTQSVINNRMKIAELCEISGIHKQTIHGYLRMGLLPPPRKVSVNLHLYNETHLRTLLRIRSLRKDNVSLTQIKELLEDEESLRSCQGREGAIDSPGAERVDTHLQPCSYRQEEIIEKASPAISGMVTDWKGIVTELRRMKIYGEDIIQGNIGAGQVRIAMSNVAEITVHEPGEQCQISVTMKNGYSSSVVVSGDSVISGETVLGSFTIALNKIARVILVQSRWGDAKACETVQQNLPAKHGTTAGACDTIRGFPHK